MQVQRLALCILLCAFSCSGFALHEDTPLKPLKAKTSKTHLIVNKSLTQTPLDRSLAQPEIKPRNEDSLSKPSQISQLAEPTLGAVNTVREQTLNLMDIYQQALANDPNLASALSANVAAQELIEQSKALYRPAVNFNAGVSKSETDINFLGDNPFRNAGRNSFETKNYGVEARQPIYRKDSLLQIDQSKTQVKLADKQLHLAQQNLMLRTTLTYFDVLIAQENIALIQAQKSAILGQLEQAKANFDVGVATITDVNEAQARYDLTVSQEIAAYNTFEVAKHSVQAITGNIPQTLTPVRDNIAPNPLSQAMQEWIDVASKNNLNIQINEDAYTLAEQDVERARSGHLPTLDAVASYTENNQSSSAQGFGSELKTSVIGLQLQIPLYLGGSVSSRQRQAAHNQDRARSDIEVARRQAVLDTQTAYLNLNTSIAQIKAFERALSSTQSQVESTKLGYEVGVRNSIDVLNAQQQFFTARRDLLQARYQYLGNIIRLKAASGVVSEVDLVDINQQLVQK